MKCDDCGKTLEIGSWAWCPHGKPQGMLGEFKPYWEDRCTPEPVYVTSLAQKQKLFRVGDGSRAHRLHEVDHKLTPSQAAERRYARVEKAHRQARDRGLINS